MSASNFGKRALRWALLGLAFLPAIIPLTIIVRDGVDVPYFDEWQFGPPLFEKLSKETFHLRDLFAQHNEHRIAVTRLVLMTIGRLTHYNVKDLMFVTFAMACSMSVIVYALGCKTLPDGGVRTLVVTFLANLLLFSPVQYENWLWSMQLQFFVPGLCLAAGLLIAASDTPLAVRFLSGIALSLVSTYSSANGLLIWVLLLPSLLLSGQPARRTVKRRWMILWTVATALFVLPYFYGYQKPSGSPSLESAIEEPLEFLKYFLVYLGAPLTSSDWPFDLRDTAGSRSAAIAIGSGLALSIAIAGVYIWRRRDRLLTRALPWLSLAAYAIGTDGMTSLGRVGHGADQALSSRYTTIAICLIVSVCYLVPLIADDALMELGRRNNEQTEAPVGDAASVQAVADCPPRYRGLWHWLIQWLRQQISDPGRAAAASLPVSLGVALVLLSIWSGTTAFGHADDLRLQRLWGKTCLHFLPCFEDDLLRAALCLTPSHHDCETLQSLGYLRPALADSARITTLLGSDAQGLGPAGSFGALNEVRRAGPHQFFVSGWAVFAHPGRPADSVLLSYQVGDSEPVVFAVALMGLDRPDVVKELHNRSYLHSGWIRQFSEGHLPEGDVKIQAWAYDTASGKAFALAGMGTIQRDP